MGMLTSAKCAQCTGGRRAPASDCSDFGESADFGERGDLGDLGDLDDLDDLDLKELGDLSLGAAGSLAGGRVDMAPEGCLVAACGAQRSRESS